MRTGRFRPYERLRSSADFDQVFNKPKKTAVNGLLILWKQGQTTYTRIGVITSKRVSKKAVSRNRIRRIIRDSFRNTKNQLGLLDIIVIARHPCAHLSNAELRKETDRLWIKLKAHSQKHLSPSFEAIKS